MTANSVVTLDRILDQRGRNGSRNTIGTIDAIELCTARFDKRFDKSLIKFPEFDHCTVILQGAILDRCVKI